MILNSQKFFLGRLWQVCAILSLLPCLVLLASCSLARLKASVQKINAQGSLAVQLSNLSTTATNYAFAINHGVATNHLVGLQTIRADGVAVFLLPGNRMYDVGAFEDTDRNGRYDHGEPAALLHTLQPRMLIDSDIRATPLRVALAVTESPSWSWKPTAHP